MRLAAWRQSWMWLATSACGAPGWMTTSPAHPVSVFDAPPLAGAAYVARVEPGDRDLPGPRIGIEHGRFKCGPLFAVSDRMRNANDPENPDPILARALQSCDPELVELLRSATGFVLVVDGATRRWLSAPEVVAAALPIDSPAKALLVAWTKGTYELGWYDGHREYGTLEDGRVRAVDGGFEVAGGVSERVSNCGGAGAQETVTNLRVTLFVDRQGAVSERERVATNHYTVTDGCHPHGRRPADFADVGSDGSVRGYLERAMHHEAESVRAFERIARELRCHGAPDELCAAAASAARDERDHARRCAELASVPCAIGRDDLPVRSLVELAVDNAREGCIGEAYAALVNVVQARCAQTAALRAHYAAIATDELAHAALAHAIADWLDAQLSAAERARVRTAAERAIAELAPPPAAPPALGLPDPALAARLLATVAGLRSHAA